MFFNFFNFFAIFFGIFLPGSRMNGIRDKIFSLFLGLSHPLLAKSNAGIRFFNFLPFLLFFFSEFSSSSWVWTEFGNKFFFFFFGLSPPVLGKNNARKRFSNFSIFYSIFFGIFLPRSRMNGIRDKFFFLSFLAFLISFWLKIIPERGFLIFWIFLLFFSEFS